jgi:Ca2+-binding RTX toxin-like protein
MTTITASRDFRLRMDASGSIPELNSYWRLQEVGDGTFLARLIRTGPFFTTYTIEAGSEIAVTPPGKVTGLVTALTLDAESLSAFGHNGPQLTIIGANVQVNNASRLPLALFVVGNDAIRGSALDDVIHGAAGDDFIDGRRGADFLYGDDGNDTLIGGAGDADVLYGGRGDDIFQINDTRHVVIETGGAGNDIVFTSVSYILRADSDIETLQAVGSRAINLTGSNTANLIVGNGRANLLLGRAGEDTIVGLAGNDTIEGGLNADELHGGEGRDVLSYAHSTAAIIVNLAEHQGYAGDALGDLFTEFEDVLGSIRSDTITGDDGANTLSGNRGNDLLVGAGGNDVLVGGRGNDSLVGGSGYDRVDYSRDDARKGISVDLTSGAAKDGFGNHDALADFEEVRGSRFNDVIRGGIQDETLRGEGGNDRLNGRDGNDRLFGGSGNDHLSGENGNDQLSGGSGSDTLTGGAGQDVFVFDSKPQRLSSVDHITDFEPDGDIFHLDRTFLKNIGFPDQPLRDDFFHLGKKAQDPLNRIIYDKVTGSLYYDPDGTGSVTQIKIAILANKVSLDSTDFFVI